MTDGGEHYALTALQEPEAEFVRVPALQEQDQDFAGAHSVRGEAALSRAGIDEHCRTNVHDTLGGVGSVMCPWPRAPCVGGHDAVRLKCRQHADRMIRIFTF